MSALTTVRKYFPHIEEVVDATESITINVTNRDSKTSTKRDPSNCALVHACKRLHIADAAIIGIGFSYLIKGDIATRYKTSVGVGREITTFDRHHKFAAGTNYRLSKVSPQARLGSTRRGGQGTKLKGARLPKAIHRTAFIRKLREA
jgi:hypothetical protein